MQCLANTFWDRWRRYYIQTLQLRNKWQVNKLDLKSGDVVLVKDCQAHRNDWPLGLIIQTFPSKDGHAKLRLPNRVK